MWYIKSHLDTLKAFIKQKNAYDSFRSNPKWVLPIGSSTIHDSRYLIRNNKLDDPIISKLPSLTKIDEVGRPYTDLTINGLKASNDLIRHMETLSLIHKYFGSLNGKDIREFGVGTGNLTYCIHQIWDIKSYDMVDIPEMLDFVRGYYDLIKFTPKLPPTKVTNPYLSIGEYSLSEMEWDTIDQYWKDNFINSDNILLRINFIKQDQKKEFLDKLSKTHVVIYTEDEFQERSPNMIVLAVKNLIPSILPTI